MTQNILFPHIFHFGSYLSQWLMDFASIWVILKAESCWAALILYRIGNRTRYTIQSLYRYLYRRTVISVSLLASISGWNGLLNTATCKWNIRNSIFEGGLILFHLSRQAHLDARFSQTLKDEISEILCSHSNL